MRTTIERLANFARSMLVAASTLLFIGVLQFLIAPWDVKPAMVDFNVLYCGERTAFAHGDPYLTEPLRACERATAHDPTIDPAWLVTPFALPGYAIAFFAPLGVVPEREASLAWLATLVAGFSVAAAAVARIARTRTVFVAAVFAPTIGFLNFTLGEPVDVSIACVALAALALERSRPIVAAVCAAFAMVDPTSVCPRASQYLPCFRLPAPCSQARPRSSSVSRSQRSASRTPSST